MSHTLLVDSDTIPLEAGYNVPLTWKLGANITIKKTDEAVNKITDLIQQMNGLLNEISDVPQLSFDTGDITNTVDPFIKPDKPIRPEVDTTYPSQPVLLDITQREIARGVSVDINPDFADPPIKPNILFNAPIEPTLLENNPLFPSSPLPAVLGSVDSLTIEDIPEFTAVEPTIKDIAAPAKFVKSAPIVPGVVDRDGEFPIKPGYTLPVSPTLRELSLPETPGLLTINFEGAMPVALDAPPDTTFNFTEKEYASALNTTLNDTLKGLVLNLRQTGLNPAIEQQIWDRGRERTAAVTRDTVEQIQRMYLRSGWDEPIGNEKEAVFKAIDNQDIQDITESRAISIGQADLEQKNFQFAIMQAITYEGQLINLHNNVQQRSFDAAKYAIQAAIEIFQAKVAYFNANVSLFGMQAQVYRERIQAELAKIELFKGQLEGQRLIGDLNRLDIENYTAQINAVLALFKLYETELSAIKIKMEGDALKLQQAEITIKAFAEEIRAKSLEYDGYKSELGGEEIKAKFFDSIVGAFGKRVEAASVVNDMRVKKQASDIKLAFDIPLQVLNQETDVFKANITAVASKAQAINAINETLEKIYKTQAEIEEIKVKSETQVYQVDGDVFKSINDGEAQRIGALIDQNKTTAEIYGIDVSAEAQRQKSLTDTNNSNTEMYKATVQAVTSEIEGVTNLYRTDADVFGTESKAEETRINAQVAVQKQEVDLLIQKATLALETTKANVTTFLAQKELLIGTLRSITQVQAQLAAAFGSAINYGSNFNYGFTEHFGINWSGDINEIGE